MMVHAALQYLSVSQAKNRLDAANGRVETQPCPISLTLANHPQSLKLVYVHLGPEKYQMQGKVIPCSCLQHGMSCICYHAG